MKKTVIQHPVPEIESSSTKLARENERECECV